MSPDVMAAQIEAAWAERNQQRSADAEQVLAGLGDEPSEPR